MREHTILDDCGRFSTKFFSLDTQSSLINPYSKANCFQEQLVEMDFRV